MKFDPNYSSISFTIPEGAKGDVVFLNGDKFRVHTDNVIVRGKNTIELEQDLLKYADKIGRI
ncbi:arginine biosynthesis bifunctional protein ArgJ [Leptospira johnsonii]|uniref:Arginine biosynthesis bifunctional protein ArgJ n=1 Tax=Leptospira johnsonii TaxID=1917820 RepID=A0A2P2D7V7_9LEPT|nr:arginine biosynthesis bifunctional protein ArgJ [Leptospira johnsonii]